MAKCQDCGLLILRGKAVPFEQVVVDPHTRETGEIVFPDISETPYCQRGIGIDREFWELYKQFKDDYSASRLTVFTKDRDCTQWQKNRGAFTAKEQNEMDSRELAQMALDRIAEISRPEPWYKSGWLWAAVSAVIATAAILYQVYEPWIRDQIGVR